MKVPRAITHERRLTDAAPLLDGFLAEAGALGDRLGCLLVQLPPTLRYDPRVASAFLDALRARYEGAVAWEPRHRSWLAAEPERLLVEQRVARVAADPAPVPGAGEPGGWDGFHYFRLHGAPRIYYSDYDETRLEALGERLDRLARAGVPTWCIFDNTALGCATANALDLDARLRHLAGVVGERGSTGLP